MQSILRSERKMASLFNCLVIRHVVSDIDTTAYSAVLLRQTQTLLLTSDRAWQLRLFPHAHHVPVAALDTLSDGWQWTLVGMLMKHLMSPKHSPGISHSAQCSCKVIA